MKELQELQRIIQTQLFASDITKDVVKKIEKRITQLENEISALHFQGMIGDLLENEFELERGTVYFQTDNLDYQMKIEDFISQLDNFKYTKYAR